MTDFLVIEKNHFGAIFRVENTFSPKFFLHIFFTLDQSRGHTIANFDIFDEGMQTPGAVHLDLNVYYYIPACQQSLTTSVDHCLVKKSGW